RERADEIDTIAGHIRAALREAPAAKAPPPAVLVQPPPAAQLEKPVDLGAKTLRGEVKEYEEQGVVTAATRKAARPQDAPSVVWVITQKEIRERGYETIAEALRDVAGLHVID